MHKVVEEMGSIDIVLDEDSHHMDLIPLTLETLLPRLEDHGIYMIEDLHAACWRSWGGGQSHKGNFFNYLRKIIDEMRRHYVDNDVQFAPDADFDHVSGLHVYDSIAVLEKAPPFTPQHSKSGD